MAQEKSPSPRSRSSSLKSDDETPVTSEQLLAVNRWMNKVLREDVDADHFIESLDDGTRLCRLLRCYTKDQVEDFKPNAPELEDKKRNFELFKQCCQSTYELTADECFERIELFKDKGAVVHSLYALSKKLYKVKQALPVCDPTHFEDASANVGDSQIAAVNAEAVKNDAVGDAADNSADDAKDEFKYEADEPKNDYVFKGRVSNGPKGGAAGRRGKKNGFKTVKNEDKQAQMRAKRWEHGKLLKANNE